MLRRLYRKNERHLVKNVYFVICMFVLFNYKIEDDESSFMADTTKKLTSSILCTNEGLLCK